MEPTDLPLPGKIALVTGGASGIGFALTQRLYSLGTRIIVGDIRPTQEFTQYCEGKESQIVFVPCDVSKWSDLEKLFQVSEETFGAAPDAYALCAGLFEPPFSNFWLDPEQDGYKQVEVNVSHPIRLTRMAIRKSLGEGKRASVCIIASLAGITGMLISPLYCATKHAIVGFVKSMKDLDSLTGVRLTAILPGLVNTPILTSEKVKQLSITEKRSLSPDTVAVAMLDLLQKREYPSGTNLAISMAGTQVIPDWGVQPPTAAGTGQDVTGEEMVKAMLAPVEEVLRGERKARL